MARLARSTFADGAFHVTTRGVEQRAVYLDIDDRRDFLVLLWGVVRRFGWRAHALCLMTNHYHLVLETKVTLLSRGMHALNGVYAEAFNGKYARSGHLWGDRFATWQIRDDAHLREACRYVMWNPVRAGLCDRPSDWDWSWSRHEADSD